jgi:hypothetical protein
VVQRLPLSSAPECFTSKDLIVEFNSNSDPQSELPIREHLRLGYGHEDSPTVHVHPVSAENVNQENFSPITSVYELISFYALFRYSGLTRCGPRCRDPPRDFDVKPHTPIQVEEHRHPNPVISLLRVTACQPHPLHANTHPFPACKCKVPARESHGRGEMLARDSGSVEGCLRGLITLFPPLGWPCVAGWNTIDLLGNRGPTGKVGDARRGVGLTRPAGIRNMFGCACIAGRFGTDRIDLFRIRVGRSYD